jgi:hypothetical protein
MSVVGLRLFVGADVAWPGWGHAWGTTWSCRRRARGGVAAAPHIVGGSAEVARDG